MEKSYKKRILFAGMPDFGLIALNKLYYSGLNIVGVIMPKKSDPTYINMYNAAKNLDLRIIDYQNDMNEQLFLSKVNSVQADIGVVCSYNHKLPSNLLCATKDGFINCHPSLLPLYRGANPYSWPIINNDNQTGVTVHFMDKNFDTGEIISQYTVNIDKNETMGTLFNKLSFLGANLLVDTLNIYEQKKLHSKPQPIGNFPKAKLIDTNLSENKIDWNQSCQQVERFIRALNPFICAFTYFKGIPLRIFTANYKLKKTKFTPGSICEINNTLGISTIDGIVYIKTIQFGSYLYCDCQEFIERFKPKKGDILG